MRSRSQMPFRVLRRGVKTVLMLALAAMLAAGLPAATSAQDAPAGTADTAPVIPAQGSVPNLYLPIVTRQVPVDVADRIGYGAGTRAPNEYPDVASLRAGWYVDWQAQMSPQRPGGMEYVQMVRLHQNIRETDTCGPRVTADRVKCPYATPYSYNVQPTRTYIAQAARANPGSIWLIGNEPDRPDWAGGGQDEMMPDLYAKAYYEIRNIIKAADPTARIAVAGIIQMTDLREQYLNKVLTSYKQFYGVDMPVDIWNVHNFIGSEDCRYNATPELICYGMGVPADSLWGNPQVRQGAYIGEDWRHTYMPTFEAQIRRFRQWMKNNGQQNKELIVTEYGVLYKSDIACQYASNPGACRAAYPSGIVPLTDAAHVHQFMTNTFTFFLNTKDCGLTTVDDCRLVQRWAWFSLDSGSDGYNPHGALFNDDTRAITDTGKAFRDWVNANYAALKYQSP